MCQNCKANLRGGMGKSSSLGLLNIQKGLKFSINVKERKAIPLMDTNHERIFAIIILCGCLPDKE